MATVASADTITLSTSDNPFAGTNGHNQGWYTRSYHDSWNPNYAVGYNDTYRNYLTFDLGLIPAGQVVTGATLRLQRYDSFGSPSPATYALFDVTTDAFTLNTGPADLAVFEDLGSGVGYGTFEVWTSGPSTEILSFALNGSALDGINDSLGDYFSIGGRLLEGGNASFHWSSSGGGVQELVLETQTPAEAVPEPGTLILLGLGTVGLGIAARRRRK